MRVRLWNETGGSELVEISNYIAETCHPIERVEQNEEGHFKVRYYCIKFVIGYQPIRGLGVPFDLPSYRMRKEWVHEKWAKYDAERGTFDLTPEALDLFGYEIYDSLV